MYQSYIKNTNHMIISEKLICVPDVKALYPDFTVFHIFFGFFKRYKALLSKK